MEESIQVVTLQGVNKWGKDRVKRHGPVFELRRRDTFRGQPALLCYSLLPAYRDGSKWCGWFQLDIDAIIVSRTT